MEFLWPILAKIELICQQTQVSGVNPSSGVPERMTGGWWGGLAMITGTDKTDEAVLFHSVSSVVCLDRLTRKVIASVDSDPNSVLRNHLRVQVIPVPVCHFRWRMSVAHSDTDINRHFNQAAYCRYCMDAAASATHKGYLQHFKRDFYAYRMKQIDILYQGEAFTEDERDVCVWEDGNLANTLHFQILNGTKNVAFCTMLFHNSFSSNLSNDGLMLQLAYDLLLCTRVCHCLINSFPQVQHYASVNQISIGPDNGLSPIRCQALI